MGDENRADHNPLESGADGGEDEEEYGRHGRDSSNRPGIMGDWSFDWA